MDAPAVNRFIDFVERLRRRPAAVFDWQPTVGPPLPAYERTLKPCPAPDWTRPLGSVDAARRLMRDAIAEYLDDPMPDHMLLVRTLPGTGKTTAAVEAIDGYIGGSGTKVAYAGPRHDLFRDIIARSRHPERWYEWLPRQIEDADAGKIETCRYAGQIQEWLQKGYQAMDFCSGVCGWDYVKDGCAYHRQKERPEPVLYVQHQHVTQGHPLEFSLLIGDESPLSAFTREWRIPARWILPPGMDPTEPLTEALTWMSAIAQNCEKSMEGPELIEYLGGADTVLQACEYEIPAGKLAAAGSIHQPEEVGNAPYFHLFDLVPLLAREARSAQAGAPYPHRIIISPGFMTLLLRQKPNQKSLPEHVIWLDATGRPKIYEKIFGRRVKAVNAAPRTAGRIYQVVDRANGKTALTGQNGEATAKARQVEDLIRKVIGDYGYRRASAIGFKAFVAKSSLAEIARTAHYYAARGTNEHEDADAMFIVGAPQANIYDVVKLAKMIYFERETAFRVEWTTRDTPYNYVDADGQGRMYPVSGFWGDDDLQAVLETLREDEIIQAAHRGRPVNHPVDIWLITNIPIASLPPDKLLTMREIMGAPAGVDIFKWRMALDKAIDKGEIFTTDLKDLGISENTAKKYFEKFEKLGWERGVRANGPGRPERGVRMPEDE